jgi:NAD(P)-dependent dehydrogenase (short-subunit alcohol dehydrogenase family)
LVTGGASGIGRAAAHLLAAAGAAVMVADRNGPGAETVAAEIGGTSVVLDVSDPAAWQDFADRIADEPLQYAVLNAGMLSGVGRLAEMTAEVFDRVMAVNVGGVVHGLRTLAPLMARHGGGAVAVTASLAGLVPFPSDPFYSLSKHALIGFVRSVAPQLEADGVRVNLVCPGIADTPLVVGAMRQALEDSNFPILTPHQVATAIMDALLLAETGQALAVQPGREPIRFRFPNVPSPLVDGATGVRPPDLRPAKDLG